MRLRLPHLVLLAAVAGCLPAQVITFESGGLKYQTQTKGGITVMFAHLPGHLREYAIVQVAVSNGSRLPAMVRPEEFTLERRDGSTIRAAPPRGVVSELLERGNRDDVMQLVGTYEATLYGIPGLRSTNGYQQRRLAAEAALTSTRLKAAAAASAIAFVENKLAPGASTDGAVFFPTDGKPLGSGRLRLPVAATVFEFDSEPDLSKSLRPSRIEK
jgi:hypothetical protein